MWLVAIFVLIKYWAFISGNLYARETLEDGVIGLVRRKFVKGLANRTSCIVKRNRTDGMRSFRLRMKGRVRGTFFI